MFKAKYHLRQSRDKGMVGRRFLIPGLIIQNMYVLFIIHTNVFENVNMLLSKGLFCNSPSDFANMATKG